MPTAYCPSLHTTLCLLPAMQDDAGAVTEDGLRALSWGEGTQNTPPAVLPSPQVCPGLQTQGWAGCKHKNNTALPLQILDEQGLEGEFLQWKPLLLQHQTWGQGKSSGEKELSLVGTALMPLTRALLLDLV